MTQAAPAPRASDSEPPRRYAAFIRNVMIGRNGLDRPVLLEAFHQAGATEARSYLATGNITFAVAPHQLTEMQHEIEAAVHDILGRHEPAFIRSLEQLRRLARRAPFDLADTTIRERCVTFLPDHQRWKNPLPHTSRRGDVTLLTATTREIFSTTRLIAGRPGTAGPIIERELGTQVTTRNWNTIQRILDAPG